MLWKPWKAGASALAACALLSSTAHAQSTAFFNEVHTVAGPERAVPIEDTFNISLPGTYEVTLTDLGAALNPSAPLASVKLAITSGSNVVGTPLSAAGSTTFTATAGAYVVHIVGLPGSVPGSGPVGVTITDSKHDVIATFSGTLALPTTGTPQNEGVVEGSFTVATSGNYQVTLSDMGVPQALSTLTLAITVQGGALVTTLPAAGNTTVALQSGTTYDIFAVGQQAGTPNAGLYGVNISPSGGGTPVYSSTTPVGAVTQVAQPALASGTYTLKLADLNYPNALAQLGAAVTLNGQAVAGPLAATGSAPFAATTNTYQVFALGVPSTAGSGNNVGTGSYSLVLQPSSGGPVVSVGRGVNAAGTTLTAFSFDATVTKAAPYTLTVADFTFPSPLMAVSAVAVQGGALVGTPLTAVGTQNVTASAGPISFVVFAEPGAAGSLFGLNLAPSSGGTPVFETTQGVSELFAVRQLAITEAGTYGVTIQDVGFPAPLASLAVVVTQGTNHIGSIYTGGQFSFPATPGNYLLNFVAQPTGSDDAGTYALTVALAPVVTFSSSAMSVTAGQTVKLTWSATNSSSCTASGGWTGTQPTTGSATSAAINSTTTFTLTCAGLGGSTAQSVTVSETSPPPSSSHGGGGELDAMSLLLLFAMTLLRSAALPRAARPEH
jgi:plastocyanin